MREILLVYLLLIIEYEKGAMVFVQTLDFMLAIYF